MKIVIVGGGSAGWMSAAALCSHEVVVIESPNVPTMGVGESTINGFVSWLNSLGIDPEDFMADTDGSIKLAIHFKDFYKKGDEGFFYPFGDYSMNVDQFQIWNVRRVMAPELHKTFADTFFPNMQLVHKNAFMKGVPFFPFTNYALHFDAVKFGMWLREKFCKPRGVKHIQSEVKFVNTNADGVESLVLENGENISADLYVDCTGYKSILLGKALNVPFKSYSDVLPNNRAWATHMPYVDREKELNTYTDCTAIDNGWVWNIPLYSQIGTGYVYSNEFVTDDEALAEFKAYIAKTGRDPETLKYKNLEVKSGIYERVWEKNVVAIGLAAGFIEPLESTGLYTVHEFLSYLTIVLNRGIWNAYDIESFNAVSTSTFDQYVKFVALHYAFSTRRDTAYWRKIARTTYINGDVLKQKQDYFNETPISRFQRNYSDGLWPGINCVAAGMNMFFTDESVIRSCTFPRTIDYRKTYAREFLLFDEEVEKWKNVAQGSLPLARYLDLVHGKKSE